MAWWYVVGIEFGYAKNGDKKVVRVALATVGSQALARRVEGVPDEKKKCVS
jgi:hypothetical protein